MKNKNYLVAALCVLMLSGIVSAVAASDWPSLPTDPVTLTITNLTIREYPFIIQLSDVPPSFDVSNGIYIGWCVDITNVINRGEDYSVLLYSSLSPPTMDFDEWDMVNYILNHKQGTDQDVQAAIWYFINDPNGYFWPEPRTPTAEEIAMINDALANGDGYTPGEGEVLAIICVPEVPEGECPAQTVIIELSKPGYEGLTPGFWKNHVDLWEGYSDGQYFSDVFGVAITIDLGKKSENTNPTLLEALKAKGGIDEEIGIYDALARHAVAALLNAAHPDVDYPLTEAEIISAVQDAILNADMYDAEPLKNQLDTYNNLGGGIDAHGNPI